MKRCGRHLLNYCNLFGRTCPAQSSSCCGKIQNSHLFVGLRWKHSIDYSRFPKINEDDLVEQFIKGSGPGGSKVNTASNCVLLKHLPTGIVVKCHESRLLQDNRVKAREILCLKIDDHLNGEMSITAQQKRIDRHKSSTQQKKAEKLRELKKAFKQKTE